MTNFAPPNPMLSPVRIVASTFVPKPWGWESWLVNSHKCDYCMKQLFIKKGQRTSIHRHLKKDEVLHCHSGTFFIQYMNPAQAMSSAVLPNFTEIVKEGNAVHVEPGTWHRLTAASDCLIYEVSTFHDDNDVERRADWKEQADEPQGIHNAVSDAEGSGEEPRGG